MEKLYASSSIINTWNLTQNSISGLQQHTNVNAHMHIFLNHSGWENVNKPLAWCCSSCNKALSVSFLNSPPGLLKLDSVKMGLWCLWGRSVEKSGLCWLAQSPVKGGDMTECSISHLVAHGNGHKSGPRQALDSGVIRAACTRNVHAHVAPCKEWQHKWLTYARQAQITRTEHKRDLRTKLSREITYSNLHDYRNSFIH